MPLTDELLQTSLTYPVAAGSSLSACATSDNSGQGVSQPRIYYLTTPVADVCEAAYQGSGDWTNTDITKASHVLAPPHPAAAGSSVTSCVVGDNSEQGFEQPRVYYLDKDAVVNELLYNGSWSHQTLKMEAAAGSALASCVVLSGTEQSFTQPRVYYLDTNAHVNELAYNTSGGWDHSDLTEEAQCSPAAPASALACCALMSGGSLQPRVYYLDANSNVNELAYQNGDWENTTLSGTAIKGSPLTCCVVESGDEEDNEEPRVYYLDSSNAVHELDYNSGGWGNNTLPGFAAAGSALTCCALMSGGNVQPRVYYLDAKFYVNELAYGGSWSNNTLPGVAVQGTALTCCVVNSGDDEGNQQPRVYYLGSGSVLNELAYNGSWQNSQI